MPDKLFFFDTTLRDGEQVPGCQLNTIEKVQLAKELESMGIDVIEAGFPVSSPGDFTSVQTISQVIRQATVCALSRALVSDIDVAAAALSKAVCPRIHTGLGVSDCHIRYKFHTTRESVLQQTAEMVAYARRKVAEVEFYAEDAGRADNEFLARVVETAIRAGAAIVNIPDTTGYCLPWEYGAKIRYLMEHVDGIENVILSTHCHNDLGMATANTLEGVRAGARQVEVTVNGVGERAGNAALEEVAMILKTRHDLSFHTRLHTEHLSHISHLVSSLMGMPVQPNKAVVGRNAFAHSSGIHQDGVLKEPATYEIMNPKDVGVDERSIVLTARSGRSALHNRLKHLGVNLTGERLDEVYDRFLSFADRNVSLHDDDLLAMVGQERTSERRLRLESLVVTTGKGIAPHADIVLNVAGERREASSKGNGPIDAAVKALKQIVGTDMTMQEFLVQSVATGSDDLGKVHLQVEHDGQYYYGFSGNTDIVTATIEAYLDAINKFDAGEVTAE